MRLPIHLLGLLVALGTMFDHAVCDSQEEWLEWFGWFDDEETKE